MKKHLIIGKPINHSLSPKIHNYWFKENNIQAIYEKLSPKESELKVADAVLTIFKTRNDIGIFKKKALYIYIREMTDCETPHLTRVISKLKIEFYELYQKYEDEGLIIHNVNYVK